MAINILTRRLLIAGLEIFRFFINSIAGRLHSIFKIFKKLYSQSAILGFSFSFFQKKLYSRPAIRAFSFFFSQKNLLGFVLLCFKIV